MPTSQQPEDGILIIEKLILENPKQNIIDFGAGEGKWGRRLCQKVQRIDGVEIWGPNIEKCCLKVHYNSIFECDMRVFFKSRFYCKKYDTAILGDVLEHLHYKDALKFIEDLKKEINTIFLIIPITLCIQDGWAIGNPYETHLYQWTDSEVQQKLGFKLLHMGSNPNGLVQIGTYIWQKPKES